MNRLYFYFTAVVCLLFTSCFSHVNIKAANSVKKVKDDLYTMTFEGDYGFDTFLEQGGAKSDSEVADYLTKFITSRNVTVQTDDQGCSTIKGCTEDGKAFFGRNFDWRPCLTMIIKTYPENGYASISTCNLENLGFGDNYEPKGFVNSLKAIAGIYVPMDGMNEKGLCVADLVIDTEERTNQNSGKTNITTTTAIRLLLDKAATVDEAVELLKEYDMHTSADMMHHISICDASGKSAVIEYVNDEMVVTETPVVTNFYLASGDHYGIGSFQSKERYEILLKAVNDGRNKSEDDIKLALFSVSQGVVGDEYDITAWSCVYNQTDVTIDFYFREDYENKISLKL